MHFSDRETASLRSFVRRAKRLEEHSLIKENIIRAHFKFDFDTTKGTSIETLRMDDELLDSLLVRLRPFFMDEEDIFLFKIINLIKREFPIDTLRDQLDDLKMLANSRGKYGFVLLRSETKIRTSEDIWKASLYAERFHNDDKQKAILEELKHIDPIVYSIFMNATVNKTKAVISMQRFLSAELTGIVA